MLDGLLVHKGKNDFSGFLPTLLLNLDWSSHFQAFFLNTISLALLRFLSLTALFTLHYSLFVRLLQSFLQHSDLVKLRNSNLVHDGTT